MIFVFVVGRTRVSAVSMFEYVCFLVLNVRAWRFLAALIAFFVGLLVKNDVLRKDHRYYYHHHVSAISHSLWFPFLCVGFIQFLLPFFLHPSLRPFTPPFVPPSPPLFVVVLWHGHD